MQLCAWLGASKSSPRPCGERSVLDPAGASPIPPAAMGFWSLLWASGQGAPSAFLSVHLLLLEKAAAARKMRQAPKNHY